MSRSGRDVTAEPVPYDLLHANLDTARLAPRGWNPQACRLVVVQDTTVRRRLRELYLDGWYQYRAMGAAGLVPWAPITDRAAEAEAAARAADMVPPPDRAGFAEQLDRVPGLLVLLADLRGLASGDRDL